MTHLSMTYRFHSPTTELIHEDSTLICEAREEGQANQFDTYDTEDYTMPKQGCL